MRHSRQREIQSHYLAAMGIQQWVRRSLPEAITPLAEEDLAAEQTVQVLAVEQLDWDGLSRRVAQCTRCELHGTRTQTVFGVGDHQARCMIIGEAPGADEDRLGEPFVGRAGQLLNAMLRATGLERGEVYITNMLKCRPPKNRDPRPDEIAACDAYLKRQIELLQPRVIMAVGRIAAQNLLNITASLARLRGTRHSYAQTGIPVVVTYHPAYLLRSPLEKRKAWEDLKTVRALIAGTT